MCMRAENCFPNSSQQFAESWIARYVGAKYQRVGKTPNQLFCLDVTSIGDGRANHEVVLTGVTIEKRLEPSQQRCEKRDALSTAESFKRIRKSFRQNE